MQDERLERAWQRCRFAEGDWLPLGDKQKNTAHFLDPSIKWYESLSHLGKVIHFHSKTHWFRGREKSKNLLDLMEGQEGFQGQGPVPLQSRVLLPPAERQETLPLSRAAINAGQGLPTTIGRNRNSVKTNLWSLGIQGLLRQTMDQEHWISLLTSHYDPGTEWQAVYCYDGAKAWREKLLRCRLIRTAESRGWSQYTEGKPLESMVQYLAQSTTQTFTGIWSPWCTWGVHACMCVRVCILII